MRAIWGLIGFCDKYIEQEKPWGTKDQKVINNLLIVLATIANLLQPFLPETSEKILKQLEGKIKKAKPLFPRI